MLQQRFRFLVSYFSNTFSSWSNFSLKCAKDCFPGLDFFPPFLAARKSDFSVPLSRNNGNRETRASCTRPHAYCKVAEFLDTSFLGLWSVPGCYIPILSLCEGFSSQEATDVSDLTWPHFSLYVGFLLQEATDVSDPTWVCPQESRLSREGRTDPATCTGTLVTR